MDRLTASFWALIATLTLAAAFFGAGAETQRRSLQKASAKLESGALVRLATVVDGSTVVLANERDERTTVSILGIRSIAGRAQRDPLAIWGEAAENELERIAAGRPVRVLVHTQPRDRQGRALATLFVDDQDVGMRLVTEGLALVYPVYPFPTMPLYLREQDAARTARRGFWFHPEAPARAQALAHEWSRLPP